MTQATLIKNNRSQSISLPVNMCFDSHVTTVNVRMVGNERIISPVGHSWDSFFLSDEFQVSDDFMQERDIFPSSSRESL